MVPAAQDTKDTRTVDFLNDKIQTVADLSTLENLLSSVKGQQELLRRQLEKAEQDVSKAQIDSQQHESRMAAKIQEFEGLQSEMNGRFDAVTTSQNASDLVMRLRMSMAKLRQFDISKGYISILISVDQLSEQARREIVIDPVAALVPYNKLAQLSKQLRSRNEDAEDAAVHLVDFVDQSTGVLWNEMRTKLSNQFQEVLTSIGWPKTDISSPSMNDFENGFSKLLVLRKSDEDISMNLSASYSALPPKASKHAPLLAFEVLVKPLALNFRYHYEGDRPTNRVDKPEWYFAHMLNLLRNYGPFFTQSVQPILDINGLEERDALHEFITAIIPVLRRKIDRDLPVIMAQGALSSHFVEEMIKFDTTLREEFFYSPYGTEPSQWRGLTYEILAQNNGAFFESWLSAEKEFALTRYESVIAAPDAFIIDYDSVEPYETKPTKSAIRLKDLLETVTDHYKPLVSFSQCIRFLIEVQIAILDQYHDRLHSSVEAFIMLSSSLARAVHGADKLEADSVGGVGGLERLCRVYGSSSYMETCMSDWNEELFFLELWDELQSRSQSGQKVTGAGMSIDAIATRTSNSIMSGTDHDGALFDETSSAFRKLRERVEKLIIDLVITALKEDLKAYTRISQWQSMDGFSDNIGISPSSELAQILKDLPLFGDFLSRVLSQIVFQQLFRQILLSLETFIIDNVVLRHQFSEQGGRQFQRDMQAIWSAITTWLPDVTNTMKRLRESCQLLLLSRTPSSPVSPSVDQVNPQHERQPMVKPTKDLKYVVDRVFEDNEKGRKVIEELGIYNLSVQEVRNILQRRIDSWS